MGFEWVSGENLPEAYERAIKKLYMHGTEVPCEDWNTSCVELSMMMIVKNPLAEPMISMLSVATPESLQKYVMEMCDGLIDWSIEFGLEPYTYHDRIMRQWQNAVSELKRSKSTRRACINVRTIEDCGSSDPACLQWLGFRIHANKLEMTAFFRSNDACRATFMNAFALIMLQKKMLEELKDVYPDLEMGCYKHYVDSFHTYADNSGRFTTLLNYFRRIRTSEPEDIRADYVDEWQDMMEEYIDKIVKENESKKAEYEQNT